MNTTKITAICHYCERSIIWVPEDGREFDGVYRAYEWIDPEATGDDSIWRETCDSHDSFMAEHEPVKGPA